MSRPASIPFSRRAPEDTIVRGDERFSRNEIDRPIKAADFLFSVLNQRFGISPEFVHIVRPGGYPENTPSQVAARIVEATGSVAIADIGCGTANSLVSWGNKIANLTRCKLGSIGMTGVSRQDYSNESMHAGTIRALRGAHPLVRYIIGDAENMTDIETDSQDVVLAFNSLIYAVHPDIWLDEMIRIGRPGGTVLFNSTFRQSEEGQPLIRSLDKLHDADVTILRANLMMPEVGPNSPPAVTQMMMGMTENTVLYRVDIPQS